MVKYTFGWDNTDVLASGNSTGQRAMYRYKSVGGDFITTGFTPTNDLPTSAITVDTPVLSDNRVVELKIQSICTINGPIDNSSGIKEIITFACILPIITKGENSSTILLNVGGLDITKARLTLRKNSDDSLIIQSTVNKVSNQITLTRIGLITNTSYYWQVELYAIVGGVEVISSSVEYIGEPCRYNFTTLACLPITAVTVSSIELT